MKKPALFVDSVNVSYFSGARLAGGAVLITEKNSYFFTKDPDSARRGKIKNVISTGENSVFDELGKKLKEQGVKKVRTPVSALTNQQYRILSKKVSIEDSTEEISRKRMIKSGEEIKKIKKACAYADEAMKAAKDAVKVGVTEKKIRAEAMNAVMSKCEDQSFPMIVASGANSLLTHCYPSDKKIKEKEMIIIDLGFSHEGYHSDLTRTFAVNPTEEQVILYETVKKAYEIAVKSIAKKAKFSDVNEKVRMFFEENSLTGFWKYSLGHGVGMEVHENPLINRNSKHCAENRMVFAVEPGLHIPKIGGCRIEDTFLFDKKPVALTKFPKVIYS